MDLSNLTKDGTWGIAAAAFVNPMYLMAPAGTAGNTVSTGFDVSAAAAVLVAFEGTYTGAVVVHQQTLDPTGASGWFSVEGSPSTGGSATSTGSTSGTCYVFPCVGVRHRVKVTALSTGTLECRVRLDTSTLSSTGSGGGGGGAGGDVNISEVGGNAVGSTVPVDGTVAVSSVGGTVAVSGSVSITGTPSVSITGTPSVTVSGGATAALQSGVQGTYGAATANKSVILDSATGSPVDYTTASPIKGGTAADAAVANPPVTTGGRAATANPTAVQNADVVDTMHDKLGKLVAVAALRDLKANQVTTITSSVAETTIVTAAGASVFADLYGLIITNTSASDVNVAIKDVTAGTTRLNIAVKAGTSAGFMLDAGSAIKQSTANSAWSATSSASVASLIITALTVQNT